MTTLQKAIVGAAFVATVAVGIYESRQASTLRSQVQALQDQQSRLAEQNQQLQNEGASARSQLSALRDENARLNRNTGELLKLRGQVGLLRSEVQDSQQIQTDPAQLAAKSWVAKMDLLKRWIEQRPEHQIPEFQYLQESNWLEAVRNTTMEGEHAPKNAAYDLRQMAKDEFAHHMSDALRRFVTENNGDLPNEISELAPLFRPALSDDIFSRYKLLHSGKLVDLPKGEWLVREIAPPLDDNEKDGLVRMINTSDWLRVRRKQ
jgi:hypothetical protein